MVAETVVPQPGVASISSSPPASMTRSRMPISPKPPLAAAGSKPHPSSLTVTSTVSSLALDQRLGARGMRVLGDVGQRLLHEPVERALELAGTVARVPVAQSDEDVDLHRLPAARCARAQALRRAGASADLVQRRRAQLGDQRAEVVDLDVDLLGRLVERVAQLAALASPRSAAESSTRRAAEPLQRLVVKLSRPAPALLLGGLDAVAQPLGLATDCAVATAVAALAAKAAQQALVLGAEPGPVADAVERGEHAEAGAPEAQRHEQRRLGLETPSSLSVACARRQPGEALGASACCRTRPGSVPSIGIRMPWQLGLELPGDRRDDELARRRRAGSASRGRRPARARA